MNAETLKDFLISLGFKVDDVGARKFESSLPEFPSTVFPRGRVLHGTVQQYLDNVANQCGAPAGSSLMAG